jgi:hypothetical protein
MTFLCILSAACFVWALGAALVGVIASDRYHPIARLCLILSRLGGRMSPHREPVAGRFHPEAGPGWVTLDVTPLVDNNTHDVLDLLSSDEFFEEFVALASADQTGQHDGHVPDRLTFEELKNRLVERLATRTAMTGPQAVRIGRQVAELGLHLVGGGEAIKADRPAAGLPARKHRRTA